MSESCLYTSARYYIFLGVLCLLFICTIPASCLSANTNERRPFVVTKVKNLTNKPGWEDHLIAYGIRNIVNDELYQSGKYVPVEDDPEMLSRIDNFIAHNWNSVSELKEPAIKYDTRVRVFVKSFKTSRVRSIGLFSAAKTTLKVGVRIEIEEKDQPVIALKGTGKGVTKSLGVLFEIRQDKVHFNETSVGQATQKAIEDALANL